MRRGLLCMLEDVEGRLSLLEVAEIGGARDNEGDALCAALYAGGRGRWALFAGSIQGVRGVRGGGGAGGYGLCYSAN